MDRNFFALSLGLAGLILLPGLGHAQPNKGASDNKVAAALTIQFGNQTDATGLLDDHTALAL